MKDDQKRKLRFAAIGDLHTRESSDGEFQGMFNEISQQADLLLLCGDLTDLGLLEEAEVLARELQHCTIPVLAVLGNHDYHSNRQHEIAHLLMQHKVTFIHGTDYVIEKDGVKYGFTGAKGFGGGFQPTMWGRFGEREQKAFYDAVTQEVETLENGLLRLQRARDIHKKFVALHFSPISATLKGEIPELFPFLGSTRLEEVIDRYEITAVFHAHAHFGIHEGKTAKDIPVYNVAIPVLQNMHGKKSYKIFEF